MTGRISNAKKNRFVFGSSLGECRITPGVPVHWIMLVLKQVRALLSRESIRMCVSRGLQLSRHNIFLIANFSFAGRQWDAKCASEQPQDGSLMHSRTIPPVIGYRKVLLGFR
jgi:hypothetical protein